MVTPATLLQSAQSPLPKASTNPEGQGFWEKEGPTFKDVLNIINPLQHLPVVSHFFQGATQSAPPSIGAKLAGGLLFGGPIGFVVALMDSIAAQATNKPEAKALAAAPWKNPDEGQPPVSVSQMPAEGKVEVGIPERQGGAPVEPMVQGQKQNALELKDAIGKMIPAAKEKMALNHPVNPVQQKKVAAPKTDLPSELPEPIALMPGAIEEKIDLSKVTEAWGNNAPTVAQPLKAYRKTEQAVTGQESAVSVAGGYF